MTQSGTPAHGANSRLDCETQLPMLRRQSFLTMRFNIWVILAALLAALGRDSIPSTRAKRQERVEAHLHVGQKKVRPIEPAPAPIRYFSVAEFAPRSPGVSEYGYPRGVREFGTVIRLARRPDPQQALDAFSAWTRYSSLV